MIINMKKKNSNSGNPDKKRIAGAIVKKGWDMAATGGKKFGKMTADMLGKSGVANPFDLKSSKYSSEDKAIEMMTKATEQAEIELKMPPIGKVKKTKVTVKGPEDEKAKADRYDSGLDGLNTKKVKTKNRYRKSEELPDLKLKAEVLF